MPTIAQVADTVKVLGKSFEAVIAVGQKLEELGSLEQAETELKAARDRALAEAYAAKATLADLQSQSGAAAAVLGNTHTQTESLLASAKSAAQDIIGKADADAASLISAAGQKAIAIEAQIAERTAFRDDLNTQVGVARGELADLTASLARVKDEYRKLVN